MLNLFKVFLQKTIYNLKKSSDPITLWGAIAHSPSKLQFWNLYLIAQQEYHKNWTPGIFATSDP